MSDNPASNMYSSQLLKGTFETIILRLLSEHGKMYGYEISQKVKALSEGTINLPEGSLYPILHKLEERGDVITERVKVGRRTRRYYKLTSSGNEAAVSKVHEFNRFISTMNKVLSLDMNT